MSMLEAYKPSIVERNLGAYLDHFRDPVEMILAGGFTHVVRQHGCKLKEGCKLTRRG